MSGTSFGMRVIPDYFLATIANKMLASTTQTSAFAVAMQGSKVIPPGTLQPGNLIRIWGAGHYSLPLLGGTANIQVKINNVTVASITTSALLNSASNRPFEFILRLMQRDLKKAIASGYASYSTAAGRVIDNIDDPVNEFTLDPDVANTIDVTVAWDGSASGKSIVVTQATINASNRG